MPIYITSYDNYKAPFDICFNVRYCESVPIKTSFPGQSITIGSQRSNLQLLRC